MEALLNLRVFLAADYSQIELRMLAEICQDPILLRSFTEGEDIHRRTAAEVFGVSISAVTESQRKAAKAVNFGLIYGQTPAGLARQLGISIHEAESYFEQYFARYEKVDGFFRDVEQQAEDTGVVETLFGFKRELGRWDTDRDTSWGNQARNTPLQGTAHQLLLMAIALLHRKPRTYRLLQQPVLEVHDALYFFVKLKHLAAAREQLQQLLQEEVPRYVERHFDYQLRVPLLSEAEAGFTLGSMAEYTGKETTAEFLSGWRRVREEHLAEGWKDLELERDL
jgi:DNA polymerase-1